MFLRSLTTTNRCRCDKIADSQQQHLQQLQYFSYLAIAEFAAFATLLPQNQCTICKIGK
jgi:hypothetical protein